MQTTLTAVAVVAAVAAGILPFLYISAASSTEEDVLAPIPSLVGADDFLGSCQHSRGSHPPPDTMTDCRSAGMVRMSVPVHRSQAGLVFAI